MGNSIDIKTDAVLKYSKQAAEDAEKRSQIIHKIIGEMTNLRNNLSGVEVKRLVLNLEENLRTINDQIRTNSEDLEKYVNKQMKNYMKTYEDAEAMIKQALAYINQM